MIFFFTKLKNVLSLEGLKIIYINYSGFYYLMLITNNYNSLRGSKIASDITYTGAKRINESLNKDVRWGITEKIKQKNIPHEFIFLTSKINKEVNLQFNTYHLPKELKPEIIFKIPDNMSYRNFFPIRSIEKRLQDGEKRIQKTLYEAG